MLLKAFQFLKEEKERDGVEKQNCAECESVKYVLSARLVIAPALRSDRNTNVLTSNPTPVGI